MPCPALSRSRRPSLAGKVVTKSGYDPSHTPLTTLTGRPALEGCGGTSGTKKRPLSGGACAECAAAERLRSPDVSGPAGRERSYQPPPVLGIEVGGGAPVGVASGS